MLDAEKHQHLLEERSRYLESQVLSRVGRWKVVCISFTLVHLGFIVLTILVLDSDLGFSPATLVFTQVLTQEGGSLIG